LLKRLSILHADIKPENILVTLENTCIKSIKLGDLGSALNISEVEITPYLVSRYYRASEIILGAIYGHPIDVFSLGVVLYELATGKYLFPSRDVNHHLKLIMEVKGPVPKKMFKGCAFKSQHFDDRDRFLEHEIDTVTGKEIVKEITVTKPSRDITTELLRSYGSGISDEEKQMVRQLADLINSCLELNPAKRITPEDALKHSLFSSKF